jgi:hypothetical protein
MTTDITTRLPVSRDARLTSRRMRLAECNSEVDTALHYDELVVYNICVVTPAYLPVYTVR